jgi:transcription elongation factor GreA
MVNESSMGEEKFFLTKKGFEELTRKLEYLKSVKRKEISEKIKRAIAFGDITENAEYNTAKDEQAFLESEIENLELELSHAEIIENVSLDTVKVGTKVTVKDPNSKRTVTFIITGRLESDPENHKISWASPIGEGLLDHKVNDTVAIKIPKGVVKFKIVKIEKGGD